MRAILHSFTGQRHRYVIALAVGTLLSGALLASPTTARAEISFDSITQVPDSEGGHYNQVHLSGDGSVEVHLFRTTRGSGTLGMRVAIRQHGDWNIHDLTPANVVSDRGSMDISHGGEIMAAAYLRDGGAYATLTTDTGVTWTEEMVLSSGSSGRAFDVGATVSGDGQRILFHWVEKVASKDTVHFIHSGDRGASWSGVIRASDSGQVEQDATAAVSYDGETIALTWRSKADSSSNSKSTWSYLSFDGGVSWSLKNLTEFVDAEVVDVDL